MKTVALIDFHTVGHHFAFTRLFAKYILQNGYRICIIYPENVVDIKQYLVDQGAPAENIFCLEATISKTKVKGLGKFNSAMSVLKYWWDTKRVISRVERLNNLKVDFVFFSWLDDHLANYLPAWAVDFFFRYNWSGLYFHPWYLHYTDSTHISFSSIDSVLRSKHCMSVGLHDEFAINKLSARLRKKVLLFPEMADSTLPDLSYTVAQEIVARANGRIKIGLVGCEKRKGVFHFKELLERADNNKYFFFLAGPPSTASLNKVEQNQMENLVTSTAENFFYYPKYLPEGEKINAVIKSLDVVFLVYEDFKSSSNFSTKAALFRKRVLATELYWIGGVTKKYHLGATVRPGDVNQMLLNLRTLGQEIKDGINSPLFDDYLSVHQESNLKNVFEACFNPS